MRKHILKHCKSCHQCSLQNQGPGELEFGHFNVPLVPMEFICMDLVGPISPQTSKGNKYMLTVIDMLTGYTIVVAIPDKRAETVCQAYRDPNTVHLEGVPEYSRIMAPNFVAKR